MLKSRRRERFLLNSCFEARIPVVVDNTNATVAERERYLSMAKEVGYGVMGFYFESTLTDALVRNGLRSSTVPTSVLRATYAKLEEPTPCEGFDTLKRVCLSAEGFGMETSRDCDLLIARG